MNGCPDCAKVSSGRCPQHSQWTTVIHAHGAPFVSQVPQKGWQCPVCSTVNAPWMPTCNGFHFLPSRETGSEQP